ncbi:MAG: tetratricopeptide repeat protein [Planctomycetaceae bacterium]|nr:tetratricopeptide repeat protein [Planctomycetaceae bacterium]
MAMDVYAPCPCGSGKKLKFCCLNIADDMDRISRLIENHQPQQAIQQLDQLERKHPGHAWAVTTRAIVLIETGDSASAREALKPFVEQHPEHEFAAVLYATAVLQADGLDAARKPIYRAFQKGAKKYPSMVSGLAGAMSAGFRARGRMLASREHLSLSLRFAPDDDRQEVFVRLLDFDNDATVPYLLRSAHPLPAIAASDEQLQEMKKALKYATVGCWNTSAEVFEKLTTQLPQSAEAWHSAGLCRAWDGDEEAAAKHLHHAATLYADRAIAVECEAVAQLLDWNHATERKNRLRETGVIASVGRLLTALDAVPALLRLELPPQQPDGMPLPAAVYQVLDTAKDHFPAADKLTVDNVPRVHGEVTVFDTDPQDHEPAEVDVSGFEGDDYVAALKLVKQAAGDIVTWQPPEPTGEFAPLESYELQINWAFPPKTPVAIRRRLENARWRQAIAEIWPALPLMALKGKTPREAAANPALHTALTAAAYVLDSLCLRAGYELDLPGTLRSLGLEPLAAAEVTPETSLNALSPLQWLRLPLDKLTEPQLVSIANRAQLVHHDRFLYETLKVVVQHEECRKQIDLARVYQTLADLCRVHERRDEAFHWMAEGRMHAESETNSFEKVWSWDLRELLMRLEDPTDPGLKPLIGKFVNFYSPKLPQMRPYLEQMFALAGVDSPWSASGLVTADSLPTATPGGLWTPESAATAAPAGKLWVPGS